MKKIYKTIAYSLAAFCVAMGSVSCDDFFEPETDDVLDGDEYMAEQTEMYTGFLGIMTRMQAVGDKAIYLTDTRGIMLEPTTYSTSDLIALYNYDDDLTGNPYADPAGYYDVVIACNDYLANIKEFGEKYPELWDQEVSDGLISSTVRLKVWAYLTLAEIYGQALWFNDPITEIQDLTNTDKFQLLGIEAVVDSCLNLMENGYNGVPSDIVFSWYQWLDPDTDMGESKYRFWDYMIPTYEGLYAKLALWKGAFLQKNNRASEAMPYYDNVVDLLVEAINQHMINVSNQEWNRGAMGAPRYRLWSTGKESDMKFSAVSVLRYDYTDNQTNNLMKHFSTVYPNQYLLRPTEAGMACFTDPTFNPGGGEDEDRFSESFREVSAGSGEYYVSTYIRDNYEPYCDDCHIYLIRSDEYHFWIIEALNQLGRYKEASILMNGGLTAYAKTTMGLQSEEAWNEYRTTSGEFEEFDGRWISGYANSNKNSNIGIRTSIGLKDRTFIIDEDADPNEAKAFNDRAIADEYLLEFACEGKTYPALIRFATRWNDPTIISSRVTPKYGARAAEIAAKIEAGGYWVPWDLQIGTTANP